jgi:pimeloyl-ACP methyl ester carboxylesterase
MAFLTIPGYEQKVITIHEQQGFILLPKEFKRPVPWLWYSPTIADCQPNAANVWLFTQLLEQGIVIAGVDVGESYGSPKGRAGFTQFYEYLVAEYGFAARPTLLAQSRGGLMFYPWVAEHPDKVSCILGIYTVCDMRSWPGLATAAPAYGMTAAELETVLTQHNPIEVLGPIAARKIPILHIHGDADELVPLEPNSAELIRRYRARGGPAELIVVPGKGHAEIPEFHNDARLVEFVIKQVVGHD